MTRTCFGELGSVKGCWGYRFKVVRNQAQTEDTFHNVRLFSFKSIQKATNNFNTKLGSGGFSSDYKGTLENGTLVVVNVLRHGQGDVTLESIINIMSRIKHRNVVEFIGCCVEGDHRIIVYEFAGDQRLDQLLFDSNTKDVELSWPRRASICLGVARGLEYLHIGVSRRVVHRDVKPSNVLIDEHYNPKIVDFEIAHLFEDDASHHSGTICGTLHYMDPEYFTTGRFTEKVDVYGFGMLLLEVITGRKAMEFWREDRDITLVNWVWEHRESDRVLEVIDPRLTEFSEDEVMRFIDVALFCVQVSSHLRPSMSEVLLMLSGGYDFNKKALRKPEPEFPTHDQSSGEIEVCAQRNDNVSETDIHHKTSLSAIGSLEKPTSLSVADVKGKMVYEYETEIVSDPETEADSEVELMQMSHDLETELYGSIEPENPHAVSESGPTDKIVGNPEMMSTSSESNIVVQRGQVEVTEQMQISHGLQAGLESSLESNISVPVSVSGPSLETLHEMSANPEMTATMSAQMNTFIQSEFICEPPFQEEVRQRNKIPLPPNVDTHRPIRCTVEIIFKALGDAQSGSICLHGRGGSGKTTVLKTLFHHPASYIFDRVIFVTIPRLAHRRKIQNEIMQQLSLNILDSYSEDKMAALIREALTKMKVLLLLDDVWEIINLYEIGIPNPGPNNSCWLVLASRSLEVCRAMSDREMEMEVLSKAEAWGLLCNLVGNVVHSPQIEPYAQAIVDQCHGLPLIISAVASALKLKDSVVEWKFALWSFQNPNVHHIGNLHCLSPQIKYCYDKLKGRDVKACFLYCALFPRDKEIDICILVDCIIAEGLLGGRTIAAYKRGHDIIGQLVGASLLEATENGAKVIMHNEIRDSALAILSSDIEGYQVLTRYYLRPSVVLESKRDEVQSMKEGSTTGTLVGRPDRSNMLSPNIHKYLARAGAYLKEPPTLEEWTQAEMIFLMDNAVTSLPSKLSCPNLQALFLQRNSCLRVIPASFFDGMCALRILNLSKTRIKSLPESFSKIKNLEVLALRDCERLLMLPPSIGRLKALEVLDLEGTELIDLPDSVGELASLKHLRVSFYGSVNHSKCRDLPTKLIPDKTISILDLRELGLFVHPGDQRWTSCASHIVEEIRHLKLFSLYFHFPEVDHLESFLNRNQSWINGDLTRFNFIVGPDFKHVVSHVSYDAEMMHSGEERCMRFVNGEDIPFALLVVLSRITSFYLDHHLNVRSLSDFGIEIMHFLKVCILRDCPNLLAVVDKGCATVVLPFLEYLSINYLWNLERIWVNRLEMGSLVNLRHLSLHACPRLGYVFTCNMLDILFNLEELVIKDCASLEYIVIEDGRASDKSLDTLHVSRTSAMAKVPVLQSLKVLKLHYLPELSAIWKGPWPRLEYVSFYNCPKLKNLNLLANDAMDIKEIAADKVWWDSLDWDDLILSRRLQELVTQIDVDDL